MRPSIPRPGPKLKHLKLVNALYFVTECELETAKMCIRFKIA